MYISDNGIQLSFELEKPEGTENCPLAILLHGFGSAKNRQHTILSAEAMRSAGFATIRADLYGHGESGGTFREHTVRKWKDNILALMDYAQSLDFVTGVWLSGHSQGGLAAALAAGEVPERTGGLILRAPAFMIPRCAREGNLLGFTFDPDHIPEHIRIAEGVELDGEYLRAAQQTNVEEAIGRYHGPVLILHGDEDDTVPCGDSRRAAEQYADCELEIIAGETHHFDRYPEKMTGKIREFCLRKAASAAGTR